MAPPFSGSEALFSGCRDSGPQGQSSRRVGVLLGMGVWLAAMLASTPTAVPEPRCCSGGRAVGRCRYGSGSSKGRCTGSRCSCLWRSDSPTSSDSNEGRPQEWGVVPSTRRGKWSGRRDSNPRHSAWEAQTCKRHATSVGGRAKRPRLRCRDECDSQVFSSGQPVGHRADAVLGIGPPTEQTSFMAGGSWWMYASMRCGEIEDYVSARRTQAATRRWPPHAEHVPLSARG